jgi:A/G-specific adenine glycosylase
MVPSDQAALQALPGIGPNTAAAIIVYTYNVPLPFIETNIRTVYLHTFYEDSDIKVTDKDILALVAETVDEKNPRDWYYALMDYGAYLKKNHGNQLHRAKAHKKQTVFIGSKRQIRGKVLLLLTKLHYIHEEELAKEIADERLQEVIKDLLNEGMIIQVNETSYTLPNR